MKFQLPQFIETEVKLIGPFTLRQFLWIAGGASLLFVLFLTIGTNFLLFISIAIPIVIGSLALAFLKIQGVPLITYFAYVLGYFLNPKKYLYRNQPKQENNPIQNYYGRQ